MPIDPNSIQTHGLFKLFWETHNDPDLAGGGLNEITTQGAQKLYQYALDHEIDGSKSAAAKKAIGQDEKDLVRALLEHPHYGAFFEQDGRVKVMELFGLQAADIHYPDAVKPDDMGEVKLPARTSMIDARRMESVAITNLP
jgi:hypothetical protein